ncbi:hypothetical protein GCM10029964_023990 [Kibdelosporangium lantanae]
MAEPAFADRLGQGSGAGSEWFVVVREGQKGPAAAFHVEGGFAVDQDG